MNKSYGTLLGEWGEGTDMGEVGGLGKYDPNTLYKTLKEISKK